VKQTPVAPYRTGDVSGAQGGGPSSQAVVPVGATLAGGLSAPGLLVALEAPRACAGMPSVEDVVAHVFPGARAVKAEPVLGSYSNNSITRIDVDGRSYVLKRVNDPCQAGMLAGMQKEMALATWASATGIGPAILASDPAHGYFVADFIRAEHTEWNEAGQEPKRSALLGAMATLHDLTQQAEPRAVGDASDLAAVAREMARLGEADRADPRLMAAAAAVEQLAAELGAMAYRPVTCHGDIHAFNALYTPQRLYLIDWEQSYTGDPMEELASAADQLGVQTKDIPKLAADYGVDDDASMRRLQLYLTIRLARRVVQAFVVMPWNRDKDKESVITAADARLQEALAQRGCDGL
jgi:aminoglycoside phosphotransferase (APT) family kinase protein